MSAPVFRIAPQWQHRAGYLHGLQQPVLSGWVAVDPGIRLDPAHLLAWVQALFDEPLLPLTGDGAATAECAQASSTEVLVQALLQASGAVQRLCAIPAEPVVSVRPVAGPTARWPAGHHGFDAAVPCFVAQAAFDALKWAVALFNDAARTARAAAPRSEWVQERLSVARTMLSPHAPAGINRFGLVQAALAARVFCQPVVGGLYQFGTGARARLLDSSVTDKTPAMGMRMAGSKWKTTQMLRQHGLPAPQQHLVASEQEAVRAAQAIGYPVVVKPDDQERGQGVGADLVSDAQVVLAYRQARQLSERVLVEKHIDGNTHRFTVVEGELIRVTRRQPGGVWGDGRSDVLTLVHQLQQTEDYQRRVRRLGRPLVTLDEEARGLLAQKGLTPQTVVDEGVFVRLRRRDNINAGGTNTEIELDQVHPANVQLALLATRVLRLDYAGVDLISTDITQPWWANTAGICEVNAGPQMGARNGETHFYQRILRRLMGDTAQVPLHLELVLDTAALDAVVQRCRAQAAGAVASLQGLHLPDQPQAVAARDGFEAAQIALRRPDVQALTVVMTLSELERHGLPAPTVDSLRISGALTDDRARWPVALRCALPHVQLIHPLVSADGVCSTAATDPLITNTLV